MTAPSSTASVTSARRGSPAPSPSAWRHPVLAARRRFQAWADGRGPRTDTLLLTQRNVYILPTRAGWAFALTLVVLLLASINYQLNLGFVLTFLLAGSGLVSMHLTHRTLRGLTLHLKPVASTFVDEPVGLDLVLTSPDAARFGIGLKLAGSPPDTLSWIDVPALGQAHAQVSFVATARGLGVPPTLSAESRFPLGLFRAWTVWRPAAPLLVYPKVERPAAALPAARAVASGGPAQARHTVGGEVEGVRSYRRGDPLQLIAWKKAAQLLEAGGDLVSRDTTASAQRTLWLDWQLCGALPAEEKLSRLTAWVLAADRAGIDYGLALPGHEIAAASGDAQRRRCLEVLALWH